MRQARSPRHARNTRPRSYPTGTFSRTGSLAGVRANHTATLLPDGRVLVVGGMNVTDFLASAEVWDPGTGMFDTTGPLAEARNNHSATLLTDSRVLVVGGWNGTSGLASAEALESDTPSTPE